MAANKKKNPAVEGEKKKRGSTRSVETFYRNAYRTQLDLTGLADMKANIMISINGLIITAIIATEGLSAFTSGTSIYLLMVLLCGCISSMVFAILAARPRVSKLVVSEQDMMTGKVNLLYFNNFQSVTEEKYAEAMWNLIEDTKSIYDMMSKQLYNMGIVLTRKYWLLRISYGVFLFGIVLTGFLYITRFMMS